MLFSSNLFTNLYSKSLNISFKNFPGFRFNISHISLASIFISVLFGIIVGCIISVSKLGIIGPNVSKEMQEVIATYDSIIDEYYGEVDEKKLIN